VLLKLARNRKIVASDFSPPKDSLYRLFKRHGLDKNTQVPVDRRRFETELSNDMWQSDCLHGPRVIVRESCARATSSPSSTTTPA
jgi:hypothetical protein